MSQPPTKFTIKLLNLEEVDFTNPEQKIKSPRSLNIISSLGLKPKDLYQISFEEFIKNNPDLKKMGKEIQVQRYNFYNEERENNIKRCIEQRREIIRLTKKNKTNKNKEKLTSLSDNDISITEINSDINSNNITKSRNLNKTKTNTNTQSFKK